MRSLGSPVLMVMLAACAGGSDNGDPDAAPQADAAGFPDAGPQSDAAEQPDAAETPDAAPLLLGCEKLGAPVHTMLTYPDTFAGDVNASNSTLDVTSGTCAAEDAPLGVSASGPEQIIQLDNLIEGTEYGVGLIAAYDAAFYVVTGCSGGTGFDPGECLSYVDGADDVEGGVFTAPAGGTAYIVVDYYDIDMPTAGTYALTVIEDPECADDYGCNDTNPVCNPATLVCEAGYDLCVGDDANDNADDGPMGGTSVALVAGSPVAIAAAICGDPEAESDWFRFTAAEGDDVNLSLTWDESDAIDIYVYDANQDEVDYLWFTTSGDTLPLVDLVAGDYFVQLLRYGNPSTTVTAYTLTFTVPECMWSGDCPAGEPVCLLDQTCAPAQTACTDLAPGDDGDDGASVATVLTGNPTTTNSAICSAPVGASWFGGPDYALEEDWYRIAVGAGKTLTAQLTWTETASLEDLDVYLFDAEGNIVDASLYDNPEVVTVDAVTAGVYYLAIQYYEPTADPAGISYTLTTTKANTP